MVFKQKNETMLKAIKTHPHNGKKHEKLPLKITLGLIAFSCSFEVFSPLTMPQDHCKSAIVF